MSPSQTKIGFYFWNGKEGKERTYVALPCQTYKNNVLQQKDPGSQNPVLARSQGALRQQLLAFKNSDYRKDALTQSKMRPMSLALEIYSTTANTWTLLQTKRAAPALSHHGESLGARNSNHLNTLCPRPTPNKHPGIYGRSRLGRGRLGAALPDRSRFIIIITAYFLTLPPTATPLHQ